MVNILSAGACKGLFQALFAKRMKSGKVQGSFGAVGAMQEKLLYGEACELLVLTVPMLEKLATDGWVVQTSIQNVGHVGTGIAISSSLASIPDVSSTHYLKENLLAATAIHFPDPQRSTAGIHFQNVLTDLGIFNQVAERCIHYPNGALAMAELAKNKPAHGNLQIGCTQVSEILYTPGVTLVAELPEPYRLRTTYAAGLTPSGLESNRAMKMLEKLTGAASVALRQAGGFNL
jgi:molybdate transport system substrate-binding protein